MLACPLVAAPVCHAAFPGLNGLIAFERDGQVLVKNPSDVSSGTPLTADGGDDIQNAPAWTADGGQIVFRDFSQGTGLSVVPAGGGARVALVADASQPNVSPDGARVAFARGSEVATAGLGGGGAAPVTTLGGAQPALSPDGALIVYSRFDLGSLELFTVPSGGGPQIKETLTAMGVHDADPDWQAIAPAPDIGALSRPVAGSPGATLTVDGTGFVLRSTVRWNGAGRPAAFVSATRLTAQLGAADVAAPGTAQVSVFTSPAGGGLSLPRVATIDPRPPAPRLTVASARIVAAWTRNGRPVGVVVRKPFARTVIAFIGAPGGRLPPGLYRCRLRAGTRAVAVAVIRLV